MPFFGEWVFKEDFKRYSDQSFLQAWAVLTQAAAPQVASERACFWMMSLQTVCWQQTWGTAVQGLSQGGAFVTQAEKICLLHKVAPTRVRVPAPTRSLMFRQLTQAY